MKFSTGFVGVLAVIGCASLGACDDDADPAVAVDGGVDARAATMDAASPQVARTPIEDWETTTSWLWQQRPLGVDKPAEMATGTELSPARAGSTRAFHLADLATSKGGELVGHWHQPFPANATLVFWARSALGNPERLTIAVTGLVRDDFATATASGTKTWMGKELIIPAAWSEVRVPIAELAPLSAGTPEPMFSDRVVMLHFITHPETHDFWIDDIRYEQPAP